MFLQQTVFGKLPFSKPDCRRRRKQMRPRLMADCTIVFYWMLWEIGTSTLSLWSRWKFSNCTSFFCTFSKPPWSQSSSISHLSFHMCSFISVYSSCLCVFGWEKAVACYTYVFLRRWRHLSTYIYMHVLCNGLQMRSALIASRWHEMNASKKILPAGLEPATYGS